MTNTDSAATQGVSGITGLHHAGYCVPDLDEAVAFFTNVLGFTPVSRSGVMESPNDDRMARVFGVHPQASLRNAFVRRDSLTVEFTCWDSPEQRTTPPINSDIGSAHLALAVTDLPAALTVLRAQPGVTVLEPQEGNTFVYLYTPWGMLIQLMATK